MNINIILPYESAEKFTEKWTYEEDLIDFEKEVFEACRCTLAFAASEIKRHIEHIMDVEIRYSSKIEDGFNIELFVEDEKSRNSSYIIKPSTNGISIKGGGRTGLLHGAYHFLKLQGWRWYFPEKRMQIIPETIKELNIPNEEIISIPLFEGDRGFDFEFLSLESGDLFIWMARNGLTMATYREHTGKLCEKLGMTFVMGGHIFENILHPDFILETGEKIWDSHKDWFGHGPNQQMTKENCQKVQFCVSNDELNEFLGEMLIKTIESSWAKADRVNIWGFDTWGSTCMCTKCSELGNGSDKNITFLAEMRKAINRGIKEGRISKDLKLSISAYEGTGTIEPPTKPIPKKILESGDSAVFYPINRCYKHSFDDEECFKNDMYNKNLCGWLNSGINVYIGEYYNVSKFEDLPLLFTTNMFSDLEYYGTSGVVGTTYMHIPIVDWGVRTLTQNLYANASKDADKTALMTDYFTTIYGEFAYGAKEGYDLIEKATQLCAQLRAWDGNSILSRLISWDGMLPKEQLHEDVHFEEYGGAGSAAFKAYEDIEKALDIFRDINRKQKDKFSENFMDSNLVIVNPIQDNKKSVINILGRQLTIEIRGLCYGSYTMLLMSLSIDIYNALFRMDFPKAKGIFEDIESLEEKMETFAVPISFEQPYPGLVSKSALERSQLETFIIKLRGVMQNI